MTPNEIQNKKFEKKMGGYRTEEVEAYLAEVAGYVLELQDEKSDLEKKLGVLADKLEEYREDEESLRAALIGAQKLGDSVVRDAKRKAEMLVAEATMKADELVSDATMKAEGMVSDAKNSIDREALALARVQTQVTEFKTQILGLYKRHVEMIKQIPEEANLPSDVRIMVESAVEREQREEQPIRMKGKDSAKAQAKSPEEEPAKTFVIQYEEEDMQDLQDLQEPQSLDDLEESALKEGPPHHRRSEFGNLRFGEEYNLTRKD